MRTMALMRRCAIFQLILFSLLPLSQSALALTDQRDFSGAYIPGAANGSGPVITVQPQGQSIGRNGGARFDVGVVGDLPFAHQWLFNGTVMPGETNATLVVLDAQPANAGKYSVLITNAFGAVQSSEALLNVYQPGHGVQSISVPSSAADMVYDGTRDIIYMTSGNSVLRYNVGSNIFLAPLVLGSGLRLWQTDLSFDGNTLIAADYSSGGRSIYVADLQNNTNWQVLLPASPFADAGTYSVAFGNDKAALITGDFPGSGPVSLRRYDAVAGTNVSLGTVFMRSLVSASGDGSVIGIIEGATSEGLLRKYSVAAHVITNSIANGWYCWIAPGVNRNGSQFAYATDGGTFIYNTNMTQIGTIGNYFADRPVGVVYHPVADLVYFVWGGSSYVREYDTTTLTETNRYNFGTDFSAATGATVKTSVRIRISRDGSLLMVKVRYAIKFLRLAGTPPQITSQPADVGSGLDGSTTLSITAGGKPPLSYQWYFNGQTVMGATNATLALTNLQSGQFGNYSAVVFSQYGCATSAVARVTLIGPPIIGQQPQSQSVVAGEAVALQAQIIGSEPILYQWRFNSTNIDLATNLVFTINGFAYTDAGPYVIVASNTLGSTTSQVATLEFIPLLRASLAEKEVLLSWEGDFTLQSATNVIGPYVDLPPTTSPFTNPLTGPGEQRFFRLRTPD